MPNERIEVEWIATATKMNQVLEKLEGKLDKQEKALKKIGDTSKKAADMAAGSFNKLEQELKDNEKALRGMAIGTKEFEKQKRKVDELRQSLTKAKTQLNSAGTKTSGIMSMGIGKLGAMVAGMVSFQTVVSAVVSELEKVKQLKLSAAETSKTFEQALADVGQNIGAEAVPEAKRLILEQAPKLGTTQEGLANLIGVAISAGAKDLKEAMQLSATALKLTVGDAAKAQALVGGTLDVASLGGSKNFEGALGQLLQVQSQVRSTNLSEFAKNIGPGLAAATAQGQNMQGVSTERALEVSAVISQIIKDQTGANTATTLRQFFTRLDSFAPELEKTLDDGGVANVTQAAITEFKAAKTFDDRVAIMRQDEGIRLQFLESQRESIGKTAVREIISATPRAMEFEGKATGAISSIDDAQVFFKNLNEVVNKETAQLQAGRKADAAIATSQVVGTRDLEGTVVGIVDKALESVNLSGFDMETRKKIRGIISDDIEGPQAIDAGISALTEAQQRRTIFGLIPAGGQVSEEDKSLLKEQIQILRDMKALLQKQQPPVPQAQRPKAAPLPAVNVP